MTPESPAPERAGALASRHAGLAEWAREQLADRRVRRALFYFVASLLVIGAVAVSKVALERFLTGGNQALSFTGGVAVAAALAVMLRFMQTRIEAMMAARFTRDAALRRQGLADLGQELALITDPRTLERHLVSQLDQVLDTAGAALYVRRDSGYRRAAAVGDALPEEVDADDAAIVKLRLRHEAVAAPPNSALHAAPLLWPLTARGQLIGVLCSGMRNHTESFAAEESRAVAALAERAAATLAILDPAILAVPAPASAGEPASAAAPVASPALARDNLPRNLPPMIGRDAELAQLLGLVAANRLVTVTGSGGVGKTRLVLEAGLVSVDRYAAGAWVVEFASLSDPALVPTAVTSALRIELPANATATETLAKRLRDQQILLVLDNCEHVLEAVATLLEALLAAAPGVRALVSSQELIGIAGEQVYRLPSLSVPATGETTATFALTFGAVRLFVERARAAEPEFVLDDRNAPVAASICRRLDGIPLAIEMAAARVPLLGIDTLAQRLDERFRVLTGGRRTALPRQRTLHATLDWSYGLLAERERTVFRRLAIFAGGFTLDAASGVATDDAIDEFGVVDSAASLVAKSLVVAEHAGGKARYRLLETTRAYALEKLAEAGETATLQRRHAAWFRARFSGCFGDWLALSDADFRARYAPEIDNVRLAVDWAFGPDGDVETGQALLGDSRSLWGALSLASEASRRIDAALALVSPATPPPVEARLALAFAFIATNNAPERSLAAVKRAIDIFRALGDTSQLGGALLALGMMLALNIRPDEAEAALAEARPLLASDERPRTRSAIHVASGLTFAARGQGRAASASFAEAARLSLATGNHTQAFMALGNMADSLWIEGDLDGALAAARDALAQSRQSPFGTKQNVGLALANLHGILTERGDLAEAARVGRELFALDGDYAPGWLWIVLPHFALRAAKGGDLATAARFVGWSDAKVAAIGGRNQHNEARALVTTMNLVHAGLPPADVARLQAEGAAMPDEQVGRMAAGV
jgi:predicted ATPase